MRFLGAMGLLVNGANLMLILAEPVLKDICLHVKPQPNAGYFCSKKCRDLEECPEGWRCASLVPGGAEDGVCQPPSAWVSAAASPRDPSPQSQPTSP